jgi:hypothetical protein
MQNKILAEWIVCYGEKYARKYREGNSELMTTMVNFLPGLCRSINRLHQKVLERYLGRVEQLVADTFCGGSNISDVGEI